MIHSSRGIFDDPDGLLRLEGFSMVLKACG
jgi:hypothetical protein